jgi:hypothetical protein
MSFNYPVDPTPKDKIHYRNFVLNLRNVLPCGKCRRNLTKNLKQLPLTMAHMKSRDTFSKYIYDLHETVNHMLHKESNLTYEQVRERYEHFRARCANPVKGGAKSPPPENGCTEPLYGEKAKCVMQIVPITSDKPTLTVDNRCIKRRGKTKKRY